MRRGRSTQWHVAERSSWSKGWRRENFWQAQLPVAVLVDNFQCRSGIRHLVCVDHIIVIHIKGSNKRRRIARQFPFSFAANFVVAELTITVLVKFVQGGTSVGDFGGVDDSVAIRVQDLEDG